VYIAYTTKNGEQRTRFAFNLGREQVTRAFSTPYMQNKPIMVGGEFTHPFEIDTIDVFESVKPFDELILSNGKSPLDARTGEENAFVHRCFCEHRMKEYVRWCTLDFITAPPEEEKELRLMESASFLGLDTNWSLATCALQLQEVAVTLVAEKKKIRLDKANVEKVLNKKIESISFNDQYEAFTKMIKVSSNIEMPILTTHLRKMRVKVLHEGYNPKPEETKSIISFSIGLLEKLNEISQAT
jgi:hypothetical protein